MVLGGSGTIGMIVLKRAEVEHSPEIDFVTTLCLTKEAQCALQMNICRYPRLQMTRWNKRILRYAATIIVQLQQLHHPKVIQYKCPRIVNATNFIFILPDLNAYGIETIRHFT